jgi:hypothetical protein
LKSKLPDFEFGCFNKDIIDSSSNNHWIFWLDNNVESFPSQISSISASGGDITPEDWLSVEKF